MPLMELQKKYNICFIGIDGSGKGTYIKMLLNRLSDSDIDCRYCYLGYSNFKLNCLIKIIDLKERYRDSFIYKLFFILYLILLPVDFLIRIGFRRTDYLIIDRHPRFEPIFYNSMYSFYNKILEFICPKPDIIFYLTGDDKIIWSRKKEYDYSLFIKKSANLEKLVKSKVDDGRLRVINTTSNDINNNFKKINEAIKYHCAN